MVGVCFQYMSGHKGVLRDQYYEMLKAFPDVEAFERYVSTHEADDYNGKSFTRVENTNDLPDVKIVVLSGLDGREVKGEVSLQDYKHPKDVIYYFGDDRSNLTQEKIGDAEHDLVYISHVKKSLCTNQAMAIVLYDRELKNG